MSLKNKILHAGLDALFYSGAHRALAPVTQGLGAIFTLHRILPHPPSDEPVAERFHPNRILEITPEFLEAAISGVRAAGLEIVDLDTLAHRLRNGHDGSRFVAFTLDDGYRDNLQYALPVFQRHQCPFTVYVATDFPQGTARLWWVALERIVAGAERISALPAGRDETLECRTVEQKTRAYNTIYWLLRALDEDRRHQAIDAIAQVNDFDIGALAGELAMSWEDLATLAGDPLATIGAHTISHPMLSSLVEAQMIAEIARGRDIIRDHLGVETRHFAYPYGDPGSASSREFVAVRGLGFDTGVTTRKVRAWSRNRSIQASL